MGFVRVDCSMNIWAKVQRITDNNLKELNVPSRAIISDRMTHGWQCFFQLLGQPIKSAMIGALTAAQATAYRLSNCPIKWHSTVVVHQLYCMECME